MIQLPNLDCDVTSACQLACVSCNRLVTPYRAAGKPPFTTPEIVAHDLAHFGKIAHTERWAALGGEPTLHPQLVEILAVVKASGAADEILVWTNGIDLRRRLAFTKFWSSAMDRLVLSVYPGKIPNVELQWIQDACRDWGIALDIKDERVHPNWSRALEPAPTDEAYTQTKFDTCWLKTYSRTLNYGHLWLCCTAPHLHHLILHEPFGTDGVCIEGLSEAGLRAYLDRTEPLKSCTRCTGRNTPSSDPVKWEEERDITRWLEKSAEGRR